MEYPLIYATWNVSYRCNLDCKFCYNKNHASASDLSKSEAVALISDAVRLGLKMILFTGGEPLLRKDLFEIIEHCKGEDLRVCLATNGTLVTEEVVRKIAGSVEKVNVGTGGFDFSRDGADNAELMGKVAKLRSVAETTLNYTADADRLDELRRAASAAKSLGVQLNIKRFVPVGLGQGCDYSKAPANHKRLLDAVDGIIADGVQVSFKSDPIFHVENRDDAAFGGCMAGVSSLSFAPDGDVLVCTKLPTPIANVRETPLEEIWTGNPALTALRERRLKGKCGRCAHKLSCGGCRASAHAVYGDAFEEDPFCHLENHD